MQVETFLHYGEHCVEGCAAPHDTREANRGRPHPIRVGRVAPLCSDKALGT